MRARLRGGGGGGGGVASPRIHNSGALRDNARRLATIDTLPGNLPPSGITDRDLPFRGRDPGFLGRPARGNVHGFYSSLSNHRESHPLQQAIKRE